MIKGKRGRRALYGLVGAVMVFTSVGGAVAKEIKPYKAPELRLVRGTEDYDLTEGITYDRGKYELMVEDTGNFDIEVLGKYTVEYSLTPLEDGVSAGNGGTVSSGGSVSGGSGSSGGGGGSGSSSAGGGTSVKETEAETGSADSQKPDQDNTGSGTEDKSDSDKNNGNSESGSTGTGSSEDKDSGDQNTSDKENSDKGNSDQGSSDKDTGDKDSSDTGSADQESSDKDSGSNSSGSNDLAGSGTTAKAEGSFFSRLAARWIGTAYAAELPLNKKESHADKEDKADQENSRADQEAGKEQGTDSTAETKESESGSETAADGTLEETEDIIYFDRIVRVVPAEGDVNIEYDEPILEIPADTELFGVRIHRNVSVATSSNAERATASDADPKQESEVLWGDDDSDGITEEGVEYDLILKNPDILLADAFLTDKDGKKIKKAKITVKDDSDLKTAAHVVINEKGVPYIENLYLGTFMVELASADPETGEEIVCDREIQVIPSERILFDAPTLYIGTRNLSYDLTAGMMARDELNQEVKALYVVDETELLNAKEEVVATPSNAEAASEESPEKGDDAETELRLKKGLYHVVIGAKHPLTGDEFTVTRKVEVVDGYYIYAPALEINVGTTDYDLTAGAEVRNAGDAEGKAVDVNIMVEDMSDLYRDSVNEETGSDEDESDFSTEDAKDIDDGSQTSEEETDAMLFSYLPDSEEVPLAESAQTTAAENQEGQAEKPALKEGTYTVKLSAVDPETGEKITVLRQVRVAQTAGNMSYTATDLADGDPYKTGSVDALVLKDGQKAGTLASALNSDWNNLFKNQTRPTGPSLREGGKADVKIEVLQNLDEKYLDFSNIESGFTNGITQNSSIELNGNQHDFAYLKGIYEQNVGTGWHASNKPENMFHIVVPGIQVKLHDFMTEYLPAAPAGMPGNRSSFKASKDTYLSFEKISWNRRFTMSQWQPESFTFDGGGQRATSLMIEANNAEAMGNYDVDIVSDAYLRSDGTTETTSMGYYITDPRDVYFHRKDGGYNMPITVDNVAGTMTIDATPGKDIQIYSVNSAEHLFLKGENGTVKMRNGQDAMVIRDSGFYNIKDFQVMDHMIIQKPSANKAAITLATGGSYDFHNKKVQFARSNTDGSTTSLLNGDIIITAQESDKLNVFDFSVWGQSLDEADKNKNQIFLTYVNDRKQIQATQRTGGIIAVKNEGGAVVGRFMTYSAALDYLKEASKSGTYTITNLLETTFTTADAEKLKTFDNQNVFLTFESGIRTDNGDTRFNAYERTGVNAYRYRVLLETDKLELPVDGKVTFKNCFFELQKDRTTMTIVGNGGETHFFYRNLFMNRNGQEVYPTVYGGSEDGAKTNKEAEIYLDLNAAVEESNVAEVYNYHKVSGLLHVQNLYNFDKLSFGNNTDQNKTWGDVIVEKELIADKVAGRTPDAGGYKGVVKLSRQGGSSYQNTSEVIWLKGKDSEVKVGSLDITGGTIFHAPRAEYEEQGETIRRNDIRNKYILTLTSQKPIAITTNKLYLRPVDMENGDMLDYSKDDIALYLPNVPDDKRQENIVLGYTDTDRNHDKWDWGTVFENDFLVPFTQIKEKDGSLEKNYTIRYANETIVLRNDTTGILGNFYDLKSVLDDIKYQESKKIGSNYSISFDYGYHMTEADSVATKQAMTDITSPAKITWTQQISQWGTAISKSSITNGRLYVEHDLHLFGKSNAFTGLNLAGKAQSGNQIGNIFANGKPVTVEPQGCTTNHDGGVAVYGGSLEGNVASTDITLVTDRDDTVHTLNYVYGGGKQENTVTGAKVIKVRTNGTAVEMKDGTMYVENIRDFDELQVGNQDENVGTATLCVTNVLDSKFTPDENADDRTSKVIMKNGALKFTGKVQSHIGTLKADNANTLLSIYKDEAGKTYPMVVDASVELADPANKIKVMTNGTDRRPGDIVVKFSHNDKADPSLYTDADTSNPLPVDTNPFKNLIRFGFASSHINMEVTDHGKEGADPSERTTHTGVGISSLARYSGTGTQDKQVSGAWYSMPEYSSLADLYQIGYKNLGLNDNKIPEVEKGDATAYFNRTGYGFVNADGTFKEATRSTDTTGTTIFTEPETAVTVKLRNGMFCGLSSNAPKVFGANRQQEYVWAGDSIKQLAERANLNAGSSLTIDGNGLEAGDWGKTFYQFYVPEMQLELKNLKFGETWAYPSGATFGFTSTDETKRSWLKMTNVTTTKTGPNALVHVRKGIDLQVIGSDTDGKNISYNILSDPDRTVYFRAGKAGLKNPIRMEKGWKTATFDTNGSEINFCIVGCYPSNVANTQNTILDGGGIIRMSNTKMGWLDDQSGEPRFTTNKLILRSNITILKSELRKADLPFMYFNEIQTNGHVIYGGMNSTNPPADGDMFVMAATMSEDVALDPTDFEIKNWNNDGTWGDTTGEWSLAFVRGDRKDGVPGHEANMIVYRHSRTAGKITLTSNDNSLNETCSSYSDVFDKIEKHSVTSPTTYTVKNWSSINFFAEDIQKLEKMSTGNGLKTIKFVSAHEDTSANGNGWTSFDHGASPDAKYHIRLRGDKLDLPQGYAFIFGDCLIRCDENENENENENEMTIYANGDPVTFEKNCRVIKNKIDGKLVDTKIRLYGGSDKDGNRQTKAVSDITIQDGVFSSVYGGGTKAQGGGIVNAIINLIDADANAGKAGANIVVEGGTIDNLYGGGEGKAASMTGDVSIAINGGTINGMVHGGGKDANVTGDIQVGISDISTLNLKSVYGGGENAQVNGSSTVTVMSSQDVTDLATITADGSNESGTPVDSVSGSKTITIKPAGNGPIQVTAGTVSGFSALNIGDGTGTSKDEVTSDANMTLTVTKRLDTWADESKTVARTDSTVTLYHSVLKVDIPAPEGNTAGHIGNLKSTGLSKIYVHRNRPLVSDGNVTVGQAGDGSGIPIQLYPIEPIPGGTEQINLIDERPMTFTNYVAEMEKKFTDVTSGLRVSAVDSEYITGDTDKTKDLIFCVKSAAHKTNIWTEYTGEIEEITDTDTDGVPSVTGKTVNKMLHISYRDNDHRAKAGYIVAMPKVGLSKEEQQKYTQVDVNFMADPVEGKLPPNTNAVLLTFDYTHVQDASKTDIDITAVIPNADPKNYFYIMHVICADSEVTSSLLDLNAPVKVEEEQIGYDTASSEYTVKVKFQDKELVDTKKLPVSSIGGNSETHLTGGYLIDRQSGIKQWAWSYDDRKDAAKLRWMDVDAANNNTPRGDTGLNDITLHTASPTTDAQEYSFRVPKDRNAASVWLYVKDDHNNTTKCQITLKQDLIDVAVPTKVSVIAIKKPNGGDTQLLAPVCYVENLGNTEVEASVSGFESRDLMSGDGKAVLKLVNKNRTESFNPDEMALFLTPVVNSTLPSQNVLKETNVKSIDSTQESTWAKIGRMGSKDTQDSKKNFLDFTFDAGYNVENINETNDGRLTSIMSYHFTAVKSGN